MNWKCIYHSKEGFHTHNISINPGHSGVSTIQKEGFHTALFKITGLDIGVSTIQKEGFHTGEGLYNA